MIDIKKESERYMYRNWVFILGAFALFQIYDFVVGPQYGAGYFRLGLPAFYSSMFFLVLSLAIGYLWRWVATSHKEMLTSFFMAVSGFRMLLSLVALGIVYAIVGRANMLPHVLVFFVFYVISTGFHSFFFARLNNKK